MIESYDFGSMVIDGKKYTKDLIVFPEKVIANWWRKEGHKLQMEDLREVLEIETKPEILVVGMGYYGLMKVSLEVTEALSSKAIELVALPSEEACQTFNKLLKSGKRVVGAFHLTC